MHVSFAPTSTLGSALPWSGLLTAAQRAVHDQIVDFLATPSRIAELEKLRDNLIESPRVLSDAENAELEKFIQSIEIAKERFNNTIDKIQTAANTAASLGLIEQTPRLPGRLRVNRSRLPAGMQGFGVAPVVAIAALVASGVVTAGIIVAIRETATSISDAEGSAKWWQIQNQRAAQGLPPTARPSSSPSNIAQVVKSVSTTSLIIGGIAVVGFVVWRFAR